MFNFDGENKLIILSDNLTGFDVLDLYSRWKEWVIMSDNSKYLPAFDSSVGLEDLGGGVFLGSYFFMINGWKIRPIESDHILNVTGNLYTKPSTESAFTETLGNFNVQIIQNRSSLTQVASSTSGINTDAIASAVWDYLLLNSTVDGSTKEALEIILRNSKLIPLSI